MMYLLLLAVTCLSLHLLATEQTTNNNKINVKTFLQNQPCNKKNAQGHTFFYQLARDCDRFNYSKEALLLLEEYVGTHRGYVPNPFIKHEKIINNQITHNTAKEEAIAQLHDTGNPVCGFLKEFFSQMEIAFVDLSGSKRGREQLITGTVPREQEIDN